MSDFTAGDEYDAMRIAEDDRRALATTLTEALDLILPGGGTEGLARAAEARSASVSLSLRRGGGLQVDVRYTPPNEEFLAALQGLSKADRVARAKALLAAGATYPRGCSEFVCAVLGIPYRQANDLMGANPPSVGNGPIYTREPGDIAGWIATTGSGHIAVYVGDQPNDVFIDVREPGAKPRSKNGYYGHEVFKAPF